MLQGAVRTAERHRPEIAPVALFPNLVESRVEQNPEATAVQFEGRSVSYRVLNDSANRLAHYLIGLGVGPEAIVAIAMHRSIEMIVAVLAVLKSGAAYLPLDPEYPAARLAYMMEDAAPNAILTHSVAVGQAPSHSRLLVIDSEGVAEALLRQSTANPTDADRTSALRPENPAYVIYTSGSTGAPKGVIVAHAGLPALTIAQIEHFRITAESRVLLFYSLSFDAAFAKISMALVSGATLVVATADRLAAGPPLTELVASAKITAIGIPPALLAVLPENGLPGCTTIIVGGEACSAQLVARWSHGRRMINVYGPTETTVCATMSDPLSGSMTPPIGKPITGSRAYVLGADLMPVPIGTPGELFIAGEGVARGYLHRPELTAEKFLPDPFCCGARMYRTGDMVHMLGDGQLMYLGRLDQQVKVRGYRVELGEVETVMRQHPKVGDAAVRLHEDPNGHKQLVGYVLRAEAGRGPANALALCPSADNYGFGDETLHKLIASDEWRLSLYARSIVALAKDKVVLDLGAGADGLIARKCIEAGAERVYSVSADEATKQKLAGLINDLGLTGRIVPLTLDESMSRMWDDVDISVIGMLGTIGGRYGAAEFLGHIRSSRGLGGAMVPSRVVTKVAAIRLPDVLHRDLRLDERTTKNAERLFDAVGYPFDLQVALRNIDPDHVVSDTSVFEDLSFLEPGPEAEDRPIKLTITRNARIDGFLLWPELHMHGEVATVESRGSSTTWSPLFLPVLYPGVMVRRGDRIEARCFRRPCSENLRDSDYEISGRVAQQHEELRPFRYRIPRFQRIYQGTPFYESLLSRTALTSGKSGSDEDLIRDLHRWMGSRTPAHMAPSAYMVLNRWPTTPNGKLDRASLPAPIRNRARDHDFAPRTPEETAIVSIFCELLGSSEVGIHDNFFASGGDSLLAVRLLRNIRRSLGIELPLKTLLGASTPAELARELGRHPRAPVSVTCPDARTHER